MVLESAFNIISKNEEMADFTRSCSFSSDLLVIILSLSVYRWMCWQKLPLFSSICLSTNPCFLWGACSEVVVLAVCCTVAEYELFWLCIVYGLCAIGQRVSLDDVDGCLCCVPELLGSFL